MAFSGIALFAKDPEKLASFYEAVLSGTLTREDGVLCVRNEGTEVLILTIPAEISESITIAFPPMAREDVAIKPIFEVLQLAHSLAVARSLGGVVTNREFRFAGFDHIDLTDVEGNVIQLRARALS
ncbi:MAG: glyoxalase/bleomycin resistance/dioxygenase family protein [Actinomycetota bacterium]